MSMQTVPQDVISEVKVNAASWRDYSTITVRFYFSHDDLLNFPSSSQAKRLANTGMVPALPSFVATRIRNDAEKDNTTGDFLVWHCHNEEGLWENDKTAVLAVRCLGSELSNVIAIVLGQYQAADAFASANPRVGPDDVVEEDW
jgi:hypothetical protein